MHPHESVVRRLYAALAARGAEEAAACYHPEIFYSEPLHPRLRGDAVRDLWRMRLAPGEAYEIRLDEASGGADGATARWTVRARVRGRPVEIHGRSLFAFRDGRISRQYDHYSLWRWSAQALGPAGAAFGWLGPVRWALRTRARRALERFSAAPADD
ncbi:MAG TPA: nuclear transport factor 2 family protein [Usitatibacter sp.]|jgi:ketosteroid isomerase-like protein